MATLSSILTPTNVLTTASLTGQAFYGFGAGTYSWTVPPGVTSVCVVCIGAGAGSQGQYWSSGGGGGGGLGWKNNIAVVPGQIWTVTVGLGGDAGAGRQSGGLSSFVSPTSVLACQGGGGGGISGGNYIGDGGGNGGQAYVNYGGGGAGGYTGNGGSNGGGGSGGGGAGGYAYSSTYGNGAGGGTGPFGQGSSGNSGYAAGGGSGGETASTGENPYYNLGNVTRPGGRYGGGGGGSGTSSPTGTGTHRGADGCVRIIWGPGRSFPSTGTGDM